MKDVKNDKQLSDELINILNNLCRIADQYHVDKELPKVPMEYYWMEQWESRSKKARLSEQIGRPFGGK